MVDARLYEKICNFPFVILNLKLEKVVSKGGFLQ
jgi:hypothetical protein